jgi:protein-S-isoprenylcysteine O-methyltransferase Ste14
MSDRTTTRAGRWATFAFGTVGYLSFFVSFNYFILFTGNLLVPKTVDSGAGAPLVEALLVNLGFITLFGVQHSIMARPTFKKYWTRIVPKPIERAVFVLISSIILSALIWQWRPVPQALWNIEGLATIPVWALWATGWAMVFVASFLINHFELFGLQQVYNHLRGKEFTQPGFVTPFLYKIVRHPLQLGIVLGLWATPTMTVGRLILAGGMTAYILIGLYFEERNLVDYHGERYVEYKRQVPKLIPIPKGRAAAPGTETA